MQERGLEKPLFKQIFAGAGQAKYFLEYHERFELYVRSCKLEHFSTRNRANSLYPVHIQRDRLFEKSQELRMLSRSLSDCQSLALNVMIQVSQFIRNRQLCH